MNPEKGHSWDNLTADLVERVVSFLDPNEVVCTVKEINKAMASQFREKVAIRLSQPVPHHAFNRHWSLPEAVHNLTRSKRRELVVLTARSGSLANLQVAVKAASCELSWKVSNAAAEGGNIEMCQWLQGKDCFFLSEQAAAAAARGGHLETVRWLLQQERDFRELRRAGSQAFIAAACAGHQTVCEGLLEDGTPLKHWRCLPGAARGGHVGLTHRLLQLESEFRSVSGLMADIVKEAAYGFDLAALQHLYRRYGGDFDDDFGDDASSLLIGYTLAEALVSPTPDWRAKVEWLQTLGYRFHSIEFFSWEALARLPDAVERAQRLLMEVEEKDVVVHILISAARVDNLSLIRYLRAGRDWLPERTKDAVSVAARAGNMVLLVELVTLGWRLSVRTAMDAAEHGHLHILKWMYACGGPELIQEIMQQYQALLRYATLSGSVEVMEWLLNDLALPWSGEKLLSAAVMAGSPAVLEWLVARGVPMGDDGELYITAAHYQDLVILRCLRRLGCPWGPGVFSRAVYDKDYGITLETLHRGSTVEVLQWLRAEGCPVDWEEARSRAKTRKNKSLRDENAVAVHAWIESIAPK
ncbi:hypothetical protein VOLCADRAFT_107723 [Volvox carteri f. nagariensis]|uniref:Uncharacterized protein n=1 Tax=Volvox carteri f. nagariensis TaxID=3068 RepID=D8UFW0_VOLCA|nr:uncharacterized protein VOLCADRAFT_107723 [Volvox carteri f. nagariensis]EFJ41405.1 hypothetical protein VOLCADRAFT_107723 [Volvox carteri f. nagariensis]|eukprot:XP_002957511.1 hypothetical protein VOLCADRAFT_107723 [Volvox carteri f. nagariensis]